MPNNMIMTSPIQFHLKKSYTIKHFLGDHLAWFDESTRFEFVFSDFECFLIEFNICASDWNKNLNIKLSKLSDSTKNKKKQIERDQDF